MEEGSQGPEPLYDEPIARAATDRVGSLVGAAERLADSIRDEAERRAQARLGEAESEAARIVRAARLEADALLLERRRRLAGLGDQILERAEEVFSQLDEAEAVRRRLAELARAVDETGRRLLQETDAAARPAPPADAPSFEDARAVTRVPAPPPEAPSTVQAEPVARAHAQPAPSPPSDAPDAGGPRSAGEREQDQASARAGAAITSIEEARTSAAGEPEGEPERPARATGVAPLGGARQVAIQMAMAGGTRGEVAGHLRRSFQIEDPAPILNEVFGTPERR